MAANPLDARPAATQLHFLPVQTRMPLKFGPETLTSVTCARAAVTVAGRNGRTATGWGETPLSVQWVWPSSAPYAERHEALKALCRDLARDWAAFDAWGHPLEVGARFLGDALPARVKAANARRAERGEEPIPWLAALACCSPFDLAFHDAYGALHGVDIYATYGPPHLAADLAEFLEPAKEFRDRHPRHFLASSPPKRLPAWHLVGGLDPLEPGDLTGAEPDDGHPVLLRDWIARDGLRCLKVKLRGTDARWDRERLERVGRIALETGVEHLSADFNCTVQDPAYVCEILDQLERDEPEIHRRLLYVEQPFPYDLEAHAIDVGEVSARKPLFMDESAHNWRLVRLGLHRGWTGVALKTCKTQTEAILSLCWARAHGMRIMVQDLTNPMLAQIPHLRLAAHAETILGVETNAMQFYPEASVPEARVHPGLYRRRDGCVDLSTLGGPGFGMRVQEIARKLPPPEPL